MRKAKDTDFFIELPGIGVFRYGRKTFLDRTKIRADYLRITKDFEDDERLSSWAFMISSHKNLCVESPEGWADLDAIELTDSNDEKIFELFDLLDKQEGLFRVGATTGGEKTGKGAIKNDAVLVQEDVPAIAN